MEFIPPHEGYNKLFITPIPNRYNDDHFKKELLDKGHEFLKQMNSIEESEMIKKEKINESIYFNAESVKHTIIFILAILALKGLELFGITLINSTFSFIGSFSLPRILTIILWICIILYVVSDKTESKK